MLLEDGHQIWSILFDWENIVNAPLIISHRGDLDYKYLPIFEFVDFWTLAVTYQKNLTKLLLRAAGYDTKLKPVWGSF